MKIHEMWACKYFTVDGKKHLGLFCYHGTINRAEKELHNIISEPYTKATVLGHVGSTAEVVLYRSDGFEWMN